MKNWILAVRLKTLPAAISSVILGSALAFHDKTFSIIICIITLLAAVLIQVGTNFANDVFDFYKGADREDRLGPVRVTQAGLIQPQSMIRAMWYTFSMAIFAGVYLAWVGGWPIVVIGLASILAGIAYTGGPYPLGYHGWGDIFVFIFFGIIAVPGTYYLQTQTVTDVSIYLGIITGMLSTAILVVNNLRDVDADKLSGKKTLAVRFGKKFSKIQYSILVSTPFYLPICLWWTMDMDLSLLISLFLIHQNIQIFSKKGSELNFTLARTARFLFLFILLLSIGLII